MPNEMTFQQEGDYIVCYINGVEVSRAKKAADGTSTAEVIDIINDQIKANPTLEGTEPDLSGLEVSGDKYAVPQGGGGATLEDIVDSAGNKRFIEGEGETSITAFTNLYKKWSLSGTHLMCVFAGKNGSGSSYQVDSGSTICDFSVPEWILNKIYPISSNIIELKNMSIYLSGNFSSNFSTKFIKDTNKISIIANENKQFGNQTEFRIQFDLLIDAS